MARKRRRQPGSGGKPHPKTHGKGSRADRPGIPPVKPRRARAVPRPSPAAGDTPAPALADLRIGHGYDLHRLEPIAPAGPGRPLIIGGVRMESPAGPVAHSDGDVLYHALVDALLGALALPDIGQLFPNDAKENDGRDSADFVKAAVEAVRHAGYRVLNVDATVVLERPKLGPIKGEIRGNIAGLLGLPAERVNVKGKTHERVDAVGEGRAVEAHVVVLLVKV
jgi:2-C-methyl-D-erythritol 2,4-cyclodiphosphate synthase